MKKSITVTFDESAWETIQEMQASMGGASLAEVFRCALGFYSWAADQVAAGHKFGIVNAEQTKVQEYLLPFQQKSDAV